MMIKTKMAFSKIELMNEAVLHLMKSDGVSLYKDRTPNVYEINSKKQVLYFHVKGSSMISFDCILFKKEVIWEDGKIKVLFEDIDGNEFYLGSSYIKSYIRVPSWCRKRFIPEELRGHEYDY